MSLRVEALFLDTACQNNLVKKFFSQARRTHQTVKILPPDSLFKLAETQLKQQMNFRHCKDHSVKHSFELYHHHWIQMLDKAKMNTPVTI